MTTQMRADQLESVRELLDALNKWARSSGPDKLRRTVPEGVIKGSITTPIGTTSWDEATSEFVFETTSA